MRNNVITVIFEKSSVQAVPKEIFEYFPFLENLEMNKQNVTDIKGDTFAKARHLKTLKLENNAIEILNRDAFDGAESLEEI